MARDRLFTYTTSQIHRYDTKTVKNYRVHSCLTNIKESTILLYRGSKIWNCHLVSITNLWSFPIFKNEGLEFLLNSYWINPAAHLHSPYFNILYFIKYILPRLTNDFDRWNSTRNEWINWTKEWINGWDYNFSHSYLSVCITISLSTWTQK